MRIDCSAARRLFLVYIRCFKLINKMNAFHLEHERGIWINKEQNNRCCKEARFTFIGCSFMCYLPALFHHAGSF